MKHRRYEHCQSCGRPWVHHPSATYLCAELLNLSPRILEARDIARRHGLDSIVTLLTFPHLPTREFLTHLKKNPPHH